MAYIPNTGSLELNRKNNFFLGHNNHSISNVLPIGLGAHSVQDENLILNIRYKTLIEKHITNISIGVNLIDKFLGKTSVNDKIFCIWENIDKYSSENDSSFAKEIKQFVFKNPNFFDLYESEKFTLEQYLNTLSKYRYSLCINQNNPNPLAWQSLSLNVIPIILQTKDSKNIFSAIKDCVLFIKNKLDLYKICKNKPILKPAPIHFLSEDYWKYKLSNSICESNFAK